VLPENSDQQTPSPKGRRKDEKQGTLEVTTPTDREVLLTRLFDAFSKPELMKRWFDPRGWKLVVCEIDLRVGGGSRSVLRGPDGKEMGMRGVYKGIVRPERSVLVES
jgi:uncharacterized protein YndB with AHSA1/START domain